MPENQHYDADTTYSVRCPHCESVFEIPDPCLGFEECCGYINGCFIFVYTCRRCSQDIPLWKYVLSGTIPIQRMMALFRRHFTDESKAAEYAKIEELESKLWNLAGEHDRLIKASAEKEAVIIRQAGEKQTLTRRIREAEDLIESLKEERGGLVA